VLPLVECIRPILTPSNTWFLESAPTNGISIGSAVFAQLTRVRNTQTYRPRYVNTYSSRPHQYTACMRCDL